MNGVVKRLWVGGFVAGALVFAISAAFAQPEPPETTPAKKTEKTDEPTADAPKEDAKPAPQADLSSPRATMRSFLVAVQEADSGKPERIDAAVLCMDTTELTGDDATTQARSLARRLRAVIEKIGVKLADIPDQSDDATEPYTFHVAEVPEDHTGSIPAIHVTRDPTKEVWQFSSGTVAAIPALEGSIAEKKEPDKPVESPVPAARRSPRATMSTFIDAMGSDPHDFDSAITCLNPVDQDSEAWGVEGKTLATKLKNVMDKIKFVVLSEITNSPDGDAFVWFQSETGNIVIDRVVEVPDEMDPEWQFTPKAGEWRFAPQTLKTLDALYDEFEDKPIIKELREAGVKEELTWVLRFQRLLPEWSRKEHAGLQGWQWIFLAALLPVGWLTKLLFASLLQLVLRMWLKRHKLDIDHETQRKAVASFGAVAAVLIWYVGAQYLDLPAALLGFLIRAFQFAFAVTAVWAGYRCVDVIGGYINANKHVRLSQLDDVLIPLVTRVLRVFIFVVVILFVLDWIGYKPTTVLGALGIGGVAVAFAAQDTIGNFFGSITVLFDRPFSIGDWIVVGDIEGTVERVGFRSTRVRTFYNSVVTVPNSRMVNTSVDNYGARRFRRARTYISVTYGTPPDKIDAFCEGIRELVRLHPYTRKDYYHVYFNKFSDSSLDILLYIFFDVPDWGTELRERHRFFVDIIRLANGLGVEFAFPTQTLWLERTAKDGSKATPISADDPDEFGLERAAQIYHDAYGEKGGRRGPAVITPTPRSKRRDDGDGAPS